MKRLCLSAVALILAASTVGATVSGFPPADSLSSEYRTNAEMQTYLEAWLAATKQLPGGASWVTVALSSGGTATVEQTANFIDSYSAGAADNLDYISTSLPQGSIVVLRAYTPSTEPITVRQVSPTTGSLYLEGGESFVMDAETKFIMLIRRGNYWYELCRQYGVNDASSFRTHWGTLASASPVWTDEARGPRVILTGNDEATLSSTTNALRIGSSTIGPRLSFDPNEVQAISNNAAASLYLNPAGGSVYAGSVVALVWTSANDGSGSTLDADLLDGVDLADLAASYALIEDTRAYGVAGDNASANYNSRQLDTETVDGDGIVTINTSENYFTLGAGRYRIHMSAGASGVGRHRAFLFHYGPPETMLCMGSEAYSGGVTYTTFSEGWVDCEFSGDTSIYLIHFAESAVTNGFGKPRSYAYSGNNFPEIYAQVHIWKHPA